MSLAQGEVWERQYGPATEHRIDTRSLENYRFEQQYASATIQSGENKGKRKRLIIEVDGQVIYRVTVGDEQVIRTRRPDRAVYAYNNERDWAS